MRSALTLLSPAKLNITLEVLGKRPDGFHEIQSVVIGLNWGDRICFMEGTSADCNLVCNRAELPTDDRNLIVRAANLLAGHMGRSPRVDIQLEKHIPVGGGMGGGSSNAAATLYGLNQWSHYGLTNQELAQLGSRLGSDVPLFFQLPSAQITGRGEIVTPLELTWAGWFVLATNGLEVSTPLVYQAWSGADRTPRIGDPGDIRFASRADLLGELLFNDLEPAIHRVCPPMRALQEFVASVCRKPARITGAGGVVFVACDEADEAERFVRELTGRDCRMVCWIARPLLQPAWPL